MPRAVTRTSARKPPAAPDPASSGLVVGARTAPATPPTTPSRTLDVFPNPAPERDYLIEFVVPEFTCNCPLTGQPDFAHFTIEMIAGDVCLELKSLKLYFWSYRNDGAFHEAVTNRIVDDIVRAAKPRYVRIAAKWNVRGGIYTTVVVEHRQKKWKPQPASVRSATALEHR